jgi:hypothetical protein
MKMIMLIFYLKRLLKNKQRDREARLVLRPLDLGTRRVASRQELFIRVMILKQKF